MGLSKSVNEEDIKKYIDVDKLYNQALKKKIGMFYDAMGYGLPVDERYTLERFF